MRQMREARLVQASRAIFSYAVPSASDLIKQVREQVFTRGVSAADGNVSDSEIEVLEVLGEGSFSKV